MKTYISRNISQTRKLGIFFAKQVLKKKSPRILALLGELGSGKTTFLQGFAKGLGVKEKVLSPTFIIMRKFDLKKNCHHSFSYFKFFYHIDCYRIKKPKEILELGFDKIIAEPRNIVAIEWADKIKKILPKKILRLDFKFINKKERRILIKNNEKKISNY